MPNENEQAVETIVKAPVTIPDFPSKLEEEPILWNLLSTHRGNGSKGLQKAMDKIWYLAPEHSVKKFDFQGDLWIDNRQDKSKTLFCAHVDTVEARGKEGTFKIEITEKGIVRSVGRKEIMGVDDGAGVAMLVSLLQANVPGMYLFTHGEECGGNPMRGSILDPLAREPYDRCIAFDRRGDEDIVADQASGILASEAFVTELAIRLNMGHKWAIGSYTDSSEFKGKIKEIVNVSIGYDANHSAYKPWIMPISRHSEPRCWFWTGKPCLASGRIQPKPGGMGMGRPPITPMGGNTKVMVIGVLGVELMTSMMRMVIPSGGMMITAITIAP